MKHLIATMLTALHCLTVSGQQHTSRQLLQTTSKIHLYYVDMENETAMLYAMGGYYDVAGTAHTIKETDTLQKQADGSYKGRHSRIIREEHWLFLIHTSGKKVRKFQLNTVFSPRRANSHLNNAYYSDNYFAMSRKLREAYPLSTHSFREAFYTWDSLPGQVKEMDYLQFRTFADVRLKEIKDSISTIEDKYVRLTDYIVQNIRQIDYAVLKDSLAPLPAGPASWMRYYGKAINAIAAHQPEYFFRLAEDLPEQASSIFYCAIRNKAVIPGLKNVSGHDETKKAFLKQLKADRAAPYMALGGLTLCVAAVAALVVLL
jgi:hypothetical protein